MSVLIKFKLFLVSIFYENKFTITIFENTVLRIPSSVQLIENCAIDNKISNSIIELDEMGTCIMKYGELKFFTLIEKYQQMFPKIERKK